MPKKSRVWLHFIKVDKNKAKYNICAEDVATKDGNTTKLTWMKFWFESPVKQEINVLCCNEYEFL